MIGGESIFRQFLPYCNTVYLTHIDYEYDADVKFPVNLWKSQEWEMVEEGEEQTCLIWNLLLQNMSAAKTDAVKV